MTGLDLHFAFGENNCSHQFLNWWQQPATGRLHLNGFDSWLLQQKTRPPLGVGSFGAGNRNRTGTLFTARDFKSLVSTYSTMPASFCYRSTILTFRQGERAHNWSMFQLKGSRQLSMNHCSSGMSMAFIASMDCLAAESNSVLPAFCSSTHLI